MRSWAPACTGLLTLTQLALAFPSISSWGDDDVDQLTKCPWDPWRALELAFDPPHPTGYKNEVVLPNFAKPGVDLSLTVAGEDDPFPFKVGPGGYGGRQVTCAMPNPGHDNIAAMARVGPICVLSEPPVMKCRCVCVRACVIKGAIRFK